MYGGKDHAWWNDSQARSAAVTHHPAVFFFSWSSVVIIIILITTVLIFVVVIFIVIIIMKVIKFIKSLLHEYNYYISLCFYLHKNLVITEVVWWDEKLLLQSLFILLVFSFVIEGVIELFISVMKLTIFLLIWFVCAHKFYFRK